MTTKSADTFPPFKAGQLWRMKDSHVQIKQVGKTLVHYQHFKQPNRACRIVMTKRAVLEDFLKRKQAILTDSKH